jgi:hypothetical protein
MALLMKLRVTFDILVEGYHCTQHYKTVERFILLKHPVIIAIANSVRVE